MKCLAALARDRGHNAAFKGNPLIVDKVGYLYKELGNLPKGLNMQNAKLFKATMLFVPIWHCALSGTRTTISTAANKFTGINVQQR